MGHRYYLISPINGKLFSMVAVEPQTWERVLLRDLNHDIEGTSIYRLAAKNEDPEAPETAGRDRTVLRVPGDKRKVLMALEAINTDLPIQIVDKDGSREFIAADKVTLFKEPAEEDLQRHYRTNEFDA